MTTPTSNPVPSQAPQDLLYNAGKLDEAVNSASLRFVDRLGVSRLTLAGAIAQLASTNVRGAWASSTLYYVRDVVTFDGLAYICVTQHTSGASFSATNWLVWDGAAELLRSDLLGADGAARIGFIQAGAGAVPRLLQDKLRGLMVSARDFGAVGDGVSRPLSTLFATLAAAQARYPSAVALTDELDGTAIQAALNAGYLVDLEYGIYLTSRELVQRDGSGLVGRTAFWKRRIGYTYSAAKHSVIKYVGAAGTNTCVVRASETAVGVVGSDFSTSGDGNTDDLVACTLRDFHVDCNGLADFGVYVYRAGNQGAIGNITAEKAVQACHVHLGCYAADFGTFGAYESADVGAIVGWDIFGWNSVEASCFAYNARFLCANNGTGVTWVAGSATDQNGCGLKASVGRGSEIRLRSESNTGRAAVLSQLNIASGSGGTTDYVLEYIEANGGGPLIDYRDGMDGIRVSGGFIHPGNGSTLVSQDIQVEARNNAGAVTTNAGPTSREDWLIFERLVGNLSGTGFAIDSNTYKYRVERCDPGITYPGTAPMRFGVIACGFFLGDSTLSDTRYLDGGVTLSRAAAGRYVVTFNSTQPDTSYSVNVEALASSGSTLAWLASKSTTSFEIRTAAVAAPSTLVDAGIFIDFSVFRRSV